MFVFMKGEIMQIAPISVMNVQPVKMTNVKANVSDKSPVVTTPESLSNGSDAIKAYILGGSNVKQVSFNGHPCSTGGFVTKRMDEVPCCCCGGKMITGQKMNEKANEFASLAGQDLADKIREDISYFHSPARVMANMIADEAENKPHHSLSSAARAVCGDLGNRLTKYSTKILNNAQSYSDEIFGKNNQISNIIQNEKNVVKRGKFNRVKFTEQIVNNQSMFTEEQYAKMLDIVMDLPESEGAIRKFASKLNGNSEGVATALLRPGLQTIEHIHPKSLGGPNHTSNYIAECAICNNPRGSMPYEDWLKIHPEYPIKAQEHLNWFQQKLIDGEIDESYNDWPKDMEKALGQESNGLMQLKVLDAEKIQELRELKASGVEVNILDELAKAYPEEGKESESEAA